MDKVAEINLHNLQEAVLDKPFRHIAKEFLVSKIEQFHKDSFMVSC